MKEKLLLFLKGVVLGLSFILPGISGGVLAISFGIYDKLINAISHFFDNFKENIKFLFILGSGIFISVILSILLLDKLFEKFPVAAILLFLGLILGGFPGLFKKVKGTLNISNFLLLSFGIVSILILTTLSSASTVVLDNGLIQNIKLFFVGFLSAATIVIPGISGSFLLVAIGYYKPILSIISEIIKFNDLFNNIVIMIPFGLGMVIGGFIIVKVIEYLLKKYEIKTYYFIIGIVFSSVIEVIISIFGYKIDLYQLIVGFLLLVMGGFISLKYFRN